MRELYEESLRRRILLAPCNDAREILAHPQLRARDLFVSLETPAPGVRLEHPATFVRAEGGDLRAARRAPRVGEHNGEVWGELGVDAETLEKLRGEGVV
jgi:crotonobetainyl-CoA:carnitine CoA-transferase CaiB-like acyl-CoA transferase